MKSKILLLTVILLLLIQTASAGIKVSHADFVYENDIAKPSLQVVQKPDFIDVRYADKFYQSVMNKPRIQTTLKLKDIYVTYADFIYESSITKPPVVFIQTPKKVDVKYSDLFTKQSIVKPKINTFEKQITFDVKYADFIYANSLTKPGIITAIIQKPIRILFSDRVTLKNLQKPAVQTKATVEAIRVRYADIFISKTLAAPSIPSTPEQLTKPEIRLTYRNTLNFGESTKIKIEVYSNSKLLKANIELKINGKTVAKTYGSEYTYEFKPDKIGEYRIEVTAEKDGIKTSEIGKITVIGDLSEFYELAEYPKILAFLEIEQSTSLTSKKAADLAYSEGVSKAADAIMHVLSPVTEFAGNLVPETYRDKLGDLADNLGYLYEEVFSKTLSEDISDIISLGFSSVKEYAAYKFKERVLKPLADVNENKQKIEANTTKLKEFITQNGEKILSEKANLRKLFIVYSEPIKWVVEDKPLGKVENVPLIGEVKLWTQQDEANFYDNVKLLKTIITIAAIVIAVIIVAAALIVAAKATAVSFGSLLPVIAAKIGTVFEIAHKLIMGAKILLGLAVVLLILSTPVVVNFVNEEHGNTVSLIEEAIQGMQTTASIKAHDTKVLKPTFISSTGHTVVVSPDGRIVEVRKGSFYYTPRQVGEYKVLSISHAKKLFYSVKSATFNSTKPNITMSLNYTVSGMRARFIAKVCNFEKEPAENLTLFLVIKNSSENVTYAEMKKFDTENCTLEEFNVEFNESGVYTATVTLSIMGIYEIDKKKVVVNVGNVSTLDAWVRAEARDIYMPTENVTLNVTVGVTTPSDLIVDIPELNYTFPCHVENQTTLNLTLPKFDPGRYSLTVRVLKDDRILDADTVEFTVKAIDVGILAFNMTKLYYTPDEEVLFNISLTNLLGEILDANVSVELIAPSGSILNITAFKLGNSYEARFTPPENGTYIAIAHGYKAGYVIKEDKIEFIVGNMSSLQMTVNETENDVYVRVFANGYPTLCNLTVIGDNFTLSETIYGMAVFNKTLLGSHYKIIADKPLYEPATYIKNQNPIAIFDYTPKNPLVGEVVTLNASSSYDLDGSIVKYIWSLGDDTIIMTNNSTITHVYSLAGNYTVNLTVIDNDGLTNSTSRLIVVGLKGDFNRNNRVDVGDVTYVAYMVVGKVQPDLAADFNGNGRVDIGDLARIAYYLLGKINEL